MDVEAISWSGTVADGRLLLGDWGAWRWGRIEQALIPDLGTCFEFIESGRCAGSLVPACALAYSIARGLFEQASCWPAETPGDELDSSLLNLVDHCTPLLDDPMVAYVIARLRDCSDAHLYILQARELAARLFMEARRIQRELAQRESRLIQSLLEQSSGRRPRLLVSDQICYGPGSSLLGELVLQDAQRLVSLTGEAYHDLIESMVSTAEMTARQPQAEDDVLVLAAWAVDGEAILLDAACRELLDEWLEHGGHCWALVPRYAYRPAGSVPRRLCRLGLGRLERLITETWTSGDPATVRARLEEQDGDASPSLTS
ncbi:MAG: hypothetical protein ACOCXJ_01610 [Planctomycetota bacterium]